MVKEWSQGATLHLQLVYEQDVSRSGPTHELLLIANPSGGPPTHPCTQDPGPRTQTILCLGFLESRIEIPWTS